VTASYPLWLSIARLSIARLSIAHWPRHAAARRLPPRY
jgi:hypothetical protein